MAGTVDLIQRAYTGIETRSDTLYLNPCLPGELGTLSLCIFYRGHSLAVGITHDRLGVVSRRGRARPVRIGVKKKIFRLKPGDRIDVHL